MCHYCGLVIIEGCFRCRKEGSALYVVAYVINDQDQFLPFTAFYITHCIIFRFYFGSGVYCGVFRISDKNVPRLCFTGS